MPRLQRARSWLQIMTFSKFCKYKNEIPAKYRNIKYSYCNVAPFPSKSASIQPKFCYFESRFEKRIFIFWWYCDILALCQIKTLVRMFWFENPHPAYGAWYFRHASAATAVAAEACLKYQAPYAGCGFSNQNIRTSVLIWQRAKMSQYHQNIKIRFSNLDSK